MLQAFNSFQVSEVSLKPSKESSTEYDQAEVFLASHLSTVILNRLAHVSNCCFLLELESALAKAVAQTSHLLISNIVQNPFLTSVFNSDINNFD